jgi:hypothetical protein
MRVRADGTTPVSHRDRRAPATGDEERRHTSAHDVGATELLGGVHAEGVSGGAAHDGHSRRQALRERVEKARAVAGQTIREHDQREGLGAARGGHRAGELGTGLRGVGRVAGDDEAVEAEAIAVDAHDAEGVVDLVAATLRDDALGRAPDEDERRRLGPKHPRDLGVVVAARREHDRALGDHTDGLGHAGPRLPRRCLGLEKKGVADRSSGHTAPFCDERKRTGIPHRPLRRRGVPPRALGAAPQPTALRSITKTTTPVTET